jgi:hypothetical protein
MRIIHCLPTGQLYNCPVQQTRVANGAKPNNDLFKKLVQCSKGEKALQKVLMASVTIDITAMQIGSPRKWEYLRDSGGGPGVIIYPVKVTYTEKVFYRDVTRVSENWIRVLNFYVNKFLGNGNRFAGIDQNPET